jgi:hypothetical protein
MKHEISDEQLNAFIDDELDAADRERVLTAVAVDGALAQRACALRLLKEQVRHAYAEPPAAPSRQRPARPWRALAMALMLAGAALGGWIARDQVGVVGNSLARKADTGTWFCISLPGTSSRAHRPRRCRGPAARRARGSGSRSKSNWWPIAADSTCCAAEVSPHADRIARNALRASELCLIACGQTVERLREKGLEVHLLPGTRVASSALEQIVTRMSQGWSYVRI